MIKKLIYSNTSWSLLSNGATALLGFVNLALIAHLFSATEAGKWFMLLTVYTLLEMLRSGWVQTPFIRYFVVAKTNNQRNKLTVASWHLLVLFSVCLSVVAFPVLYLLSGSNQSYILAEKFTALWLFSALPYQLLQWQLQARTQFKKLAIVRLIFPVCFTILLLIQLKAHLPIINIAFIYAMLQFAAGGIGFITGWLKIGNWKLKVKQERSLLSGFGKYSMLTMVTSSLLRSSDQFIIASFLGPAAVAVYSIPQKLIEAIEIPVRAFASVAVPNATALWQQQKIHQLKVFFYSQCGILTAVVFPLLIVLFLFPTYIVELLGGNKYQQSSLVLQIFCFYAALIPLDRFCGVLLDASNRPQKNTIKVLVMLVANISCDLLAIRLGFGIYGIAAASTITFLTGVVIGWIQLKDILQSFSAKMLWSEGVKQSLHSLKTKTLSVQ